MPGAEEEQVPASVSGADLGPIDAQMSPQMARSIKASTDRWHQAMKDHRFLNGAELDDMPVDRGEGKVLRVGEGDAALYPEFQFDGAGQVRPVILDLISLEKNADWSMQSLVLWLMTPTGAFDDEAPVNHLDEPEKILAAAHSRFGQSW